MIQIFYHYLKNPFIFQSLITYRSILLFPDQIFANLFQSKRYSTTSVQFGSFFFILYISISIKFYATNNFFYMQTELKNSFQFFLNKFWLTQNDFSASKKHLFKTKFYRRLFRDQTFIWSSDFWIEHSLVSIMIFMIGDCSSSVLLTLYKINSTLFLWWYKNLQRLTNCFTFVWVLNSTIISISILILGFHCKLNQWRMICFFVLMRLNLLDFNCSRLTSNWEHFDLCLDENFNLSFAF